MGKVVVFESVTLDGVVQSPAARDEDPRGGFQHGGWAVPYADEVTGKLAAEGTTTTGALLLGRRTYEQFFGYWPHQTDNPFTDVLNDTRKYVASTTLTDPLPWQNSTLLAGDVPAAVAGLRAGPGGDILVLGSGELVRSLARHDLVDRYVLLVHPLVLGAGRRLYGDWSARLELVETRSSNTGVVIATYRTLPKVER
jgi:dihydrofolate reductase